MLYIYIWCCCDYDKRTLIPRHRFEFAWPINFANTYLGVQPGFGLRRAKKLPRGQHHSGNAHRGMSRNDPRQCSPAFQKRWPVVPCGRGRTNKQVVLLTSTYTDIYHEITMAVHQHCGGWFLRPFPIVQRREENGLHTSWPLTTWNSKPSWMGQNMGQEKRSESAGCAILTGGELQLKISSEDDTWDTY